MNRTKSIHRKGANGDNSQSSTAQYLELMLFKWFSSGTKTNNCTAYTATFTFHITTFFLFALSTSGTYLHDYTYNISGLCYELLAHTLIGLLGVEEQ
jgi:hypothetical protein